MLSEEPAGSVLGAALALPERPPSPARRRQAGLAAAATTEAVAVATPVTMHLVEALFVVRESAEYGYLLFEKMIKQTLEPYSDRPGVREALSMGISVLDRGPAGEALRRAIGARVIHRPGTDRVFGYLFCLQGDWFLYALSSAAKTTAEGENLWTEELCGAIHELRPAGLYAGPASRIVRLKDLSGKVNLALKNRGTKVFVFEARQGLDLRTRQDLRLWDALVEAADYDYTSTVMRLLTGTIFELKSNHFPRSERVLPPGFCFKTDDLGRAIQGEVIVDPRPDVLAMVRDLLSAGATDKTNAEIAVEFSERGLESRWHAAPARPASEVGDPGRLVHGVFQHIKTYATGKYIFRLECSLPYLEEIHGLPVHRAHPDDHGYIEYELDFGLPPDGFVSAQTATEISQRRLGKAPGSGGVQAKREGRKPLGGRRTWVEQARQYVIDSDEPAAYLLRTRVAPAEMPPPMRKGEGDVIGHFPAAELHRDIADAALRALPGPLATDRASTATEPEWLDDLRSKIQTLSVTLQAEEAKARNFQELAGAAATPEERTDYSALARKAKAEADKMRSEITKVRGRAELTSVDGANADVVPVAAALLVLRNTPDKAPFELYEAIRETVVDLRIEANPRSPRALGSFSLRLRTSDGAMRVGPINFSTRNTAIGIAGTPARKQAIHERNLALLVPWLVGDLSAEEVCEAENLHKRSLKRRALATLTPYVPTAAARSALISCPVPETRRVVVSTAVLHSPDDAGFSPARADLIRRIYLDPDLDWPTAWVSEATAIKRLTLDFVRRNARDPDRGLSMAIVRDRLDVTEPYLYKLLNTDPDKYMGRYGRPPAKPVLERVPSPEDGGPEGAAGNVRLLQCRWCGQRTMAQPLRVPEVTEELICIACRCSADSPEPWPEAYMELWDGPFGSWAPRRERVEAKKDSMPRGTRIVGLVEVPLVGERSLPR